MAGTRTQVLRIGTAEEEARALAEAARVLRAGGLVAFPTETVYGLGADATNPDAVRRIFEAKGRPATNPLIVHASEPLMAYECVAEWPEAAQRLAARFWPGPLTLILPRSELIPYIVTAGQPTVGVRVPAQRVARGMIEAFGRPVAAPSANRSTGISPTTASHVLKDLEGRIDLVIDTGQTAVGIESTVVDLMTYHPRILRPGHVTAREIEEATGLHVHEASGPVSEELRSPGQMAVHYAPRTTTVRISAESAARLPERPRAGLLVLGQPGLRIGWRPAARIDLATPGIAAAGLYAALHQLDESELLRIIIVEPPEGPEWLAVRDRVMRASEPEAPYRHHPSIPESGSQAPGSDASG